MIFIETYLELLPCLDISLKSIFGVPGVPFYSINKALGYNCELILHVAVWLCAGGVDIKGWVHSQTFLRNAELVLDFI